MIDYNSREEDRGFDSSKLYLGKKKKEEPKLNYRKKYQGKEELESLGSRVMYTPGGLDYPRIYTADSMGNYGGGSSYGAGNGYSSLGGSYAGYGGGGGKGVFAGKSEVEGRKAA